jgi:outer membrane protein assembly factor BamB
LKSIYASPVGAAGRVYITGREGVTLVLKNQPALDVLAINQLSEGIDASPAIVGREMFLRGRQHLYKIKSD